MHKQLQREQVLFLTLLLILAAASWAPLIWQARMMNGMGLTIPRVAQRGYVSGKRIGTVLSRRIGFGILP